MIVYVDACKDLKCKVQEVLLLQEVQSARSTAIARSAKCKKLVLLLQEVQSARSITVIALIIMQQLVVTHLWQFAKDYKLSKKASIMPLMTISTQLTRSNSSSTILLIDIGLATERLKDDE